MRRFAAIFVLSALGCAAPSTGAPWPPDLPPLAFYEAFWEADPRNAEIQPLPEYLWQVRSFYNGSLIAPGWRRAQAGLLKDLDPAERARLEPKLARLGQFLSAEWSKDNAVRRVDSARLMAVARETRQARRDGGLLETADRLLRETEVDGMGFAP